MNGKHPNDELPVGCAHQHGLSRRRFLTGCAACAGAAGLAGTPSWLNAAPRLNPGAGKLKIRIVYALHGPQQKDPDWPNKGFDFVPVMERINTEIARRCPDCTFLPTLATGEEQSQKIADGDKGGDIDGYLVYQMNCWNHVAQVLVKTGKPVLYADFQFGGSGGMLVYSAAFLRAKTPNLGFIASSNIADLAGAVRLFAAAKAGGPDFDFASAVTRLRIGQTPKPDLLAIAEDRVEALAPSECLKRLKESRILAFRGPDAQPSTEILGIPIDYLPFAELNAAWAAADKGEAKAVADRWIGEARKVEGPSRAEIENSAAMYLAQKAIMKKRGANGITINCLGGFYGGHIHAYPCLGFHELQNEGLVGGCECDVASAASLVTWTTLTQGRPGYISDPVMDTAKRRIIYAHCVAHNKPFGPHGATNPYEILTHSEDRQGASIRSILPAGFMTTSIQLSEERQEILFHQAVSAGNDSDDRACRTKLVAQPVGDMEKLFTMWDVWGWHRVTAYGDFKVPIQALADAAGWKVIEEA